MAPAHADIAEGPVVSEASWELERLDDLVADLVAAYAERSARDARIVAGRLGLGGRRPETLTLLALRDDLARDRARQLYAKAVGRIVREAGRTGHAAIAEFARRYPPGTGDHALVRALLAETYAGDTDLAAMEWSYLKLRLAGHEPGDAKRVAGYVMQRILGWQKKTAIVLAKLADPGESGAELAALLARAERSAAPGAPAPLPSESARVADADDDGRGRFYLAKVGREVAYDSALQARLLRLLAASPLVDTFREEPLALTHTEDGTDRVHYPAVAARLAGGGTVLIDVLPLGRLGFSPTRRAYLLGRERAHELGWSYLCWTGSDLDPRALAARAPHGAVADRVADLLAEAPLDRAGIDRLLRGADLDLLDLAGLALRHDWVWERAPMRLSAPPSSPPAG
ncbi:hypothetical protein [Nocardia thailandica]|uniref:hypothetical protein n=1 Tax=Nocardia thailandica TaxID=257275 RepID=UPI0002F03EB6|nr:hypothetical protein [Nocardia thailandica]